MIEVPLLFLGSSHFPQLGLVVDLGSPRCMPESCDGTALGCDQSTRGTQLTVGKPQENSQ